MSLTLWWYFEFAIELKSSCNLNKIPHMCVGHQDTVMPQVGIGTWFYGVLTPANKFARGTHYYRNDL